jgi:ABC-type Fe3+/spermidine/putrescine transport system ATPase subunit
MRWMQTRPRGSFHLPRDMFADATLAEPGPIANPAPNSTLDEPGAHNPVVATARDATVRLGGKSVLQSVSLSLRAGEISVLLGPNGAGKTTLMRSLYGGVALSGGSILIAGMDPRRESKARRRIGFVLQEVALYPRLTVRENLETFAVLAGLRRREARLGASKVLDTVGLSGAEDRLVAVLSGGMQRRVNIACGLVGAPSLLLLDEPTWGSTSRHAMPCTLPCDVSPPLPVSRCS